MKSYFKFSESLITQFRGGSPKVSKARLAVSIVVMVISSVAGVVAFSTNSINAI